MQAKQIKPLNQTQLSNTTMKTNVITHLPMPRYPNIFLVSQDKTGFLVNCNPSDGSFGYICPCCFNYSERGQVTEAVNTALQEGTIEGKVRWCCHGCGSYEKGTADYGDRLGEYTPLKQEHFCAGSANADILPEVKALIHAEAVRVSK
jgi:hypothetical protein